jgi:N4-(beta-N-acetylglucosaminyl)-L-asparaginase
MSRRINRREFVATGAASALGIGAGLGAMEPATLFGQAPTVMTPKSVKPVVISSANGNQWKNGGKMACVETAFRLITQGKDVLESLIAGVNINELDPEELYVGYGGLPNADGVVQLDSCCMHGPKKRAGGVACLEGVRTPSNVAYAVLQNTDHHLLVGKGAQDFARNMGFKIEDDLNTEKSRKLWLEWKRRIDPEHWLDPNKRAQAGFEAARQMAREGLIDPLHLYGTINCDGISPKGEICGVTTTSGLAWKMSGRVGDSPILGAGLYVDGDIGAAGSTGRGEANLYNLSSYFIVEQMRAGKHPKDAAIEALKRVKANTIEKRLLKEDGTPNFDLQFYALNAKGEFGAAAMYEGKFAVCTERGPETLKLEPLLPGTSS